MLSGAPDTHRPPFNLLRMIHYMRLQRDVIVLLPRVGELLVAQHGERAAEAAAGGRGWITSSIKPRLAATNGLANFSRYSSVRA